MAFIDVMMEKARADKKTIVLPESMDHRTYEAAEKIVAQDIANLVIIGTPEEIEKNGKGYNLEGITIVDPFNDPNKQKYIDKFVELRKSKGLTPEQAKEQMEKYKYVDSAHGKEVAQFWADWLNANKADAFGVRIAIPSKIFAEGLELYKSGQPHVS